jgi:hypothetical protein
METCRICQEMKVLDFAQLAVEDIDRIWDYSATK